MIPARMCLESLDRRPGIRELSTRKFDVGVFTHGVIPGRSHTEAFRISSPGIDEARLLSLATTGELQWSIMSDWTYR
jgi:hypothetical protein